jgi:hypothetical protein
VSGTSTSKRATLPREPWSDAKLKHTEEVRRKIMACIQRLNARETKALARAVLRHGNRGPIPRPYLRQQIRAWYNARWEYLLREYEAILPHVDELPPEKVAAIVKGHLMGVDSALPPR